MKKEKWNEICFLLSENKATIREELYEQKVLQVLSILGWKEYLGDLDLRPSFQIGASNKIIPDVVMKNNSQGNLFVIEIKQPSLSINAKFKKQLFSYMRHLRLEFGLLVGQEIQLYYDGNHLHNENPVLISSFKLEPDNINGELFIELFSKVSFGIKKLEDYALDSLNKMNQEKEINSLRSKVLSTEFKDRVFHLIKQDLSNDDYSDIVDAVLKNISVNIFDNTVLEERRPIANEKENISKSSKRVYQIDSNESIENCGYKIRDIVVTKSGIQKTITKITDRTKGVHLWWATPKGIDKGGDYTYKVMGKLLNDRVVNPKTEEPI